MQSTTAYGHRRRTGPGRLRTELHGDRGPEQPGKTVFFELFDEDTAGMRPGVLAEPRPQERVRRHTMEHIVDYVCCAPLVQTLDAPVPQTVEQLLDVLQFFDRLLRLFPSRLSQCPRSTPRTSLYVLFCVHPQLVEQLVEVPTTLSYAALVVVACNSWSTRPQTVEQNVDIPAVGGIGTGGGSSGFLPGQSTSETAEQIVEIPVPRPDGAGDFQGFLRGQGSTAFTEQITEFPDPGGGQNFQPVQGSAASSSDFPGQADQGVFRTFPQNKKSATHPPHVDVGTASALEPMDAGAL